MNLGKLLGAGKSFVSGGKVPAYREDKRVYLPKFGSPKNPFATATQAELPQPPAENPVVTAEKISMPAGVKAQKMPTISAAPKSLAAWTTKLNPMTMLRGSQAETNGAEHPVQVELSLEKVKVVHNDLTDAEVEVVPLKSRPARGKDIPDLQPAQQSWEILGERLLRVTAL
ncbi:MAG TPA: hypothetical protein VMD27_01015 [Candidatus Aquilonibacter sp.]|nr:hypothetical protein [Candidatus Aquilonibacter sp.]